MLQLRISKYSPALRDSHDSYTLSQEWTSISDNGVKKDVFCQIEREYISAIIKIVEVFNVQGLIVTEVEDYREFVNESNYQGGARKLRDFRVTTGMVFDEYNLPLLISMALRELIWFKAENLNGEYLHSGYDMYFYLGVLEIIEKEFPDVFGSIYVEKAVSPYLEDE